MSDDVQPWLDKADDDWKAMQALHRSNDASFNDSICFHGQQCIENYMKGLLLLHSGKEPPHIHDLYRLHTMIQEYIPSWEADADTLYRLSLAAVLYRYPRHAASPDMADWALKTTERLRDQLLEYFES